MEPARPARSAALLGARTGWVLAAVAVALAGCGSDTRTIDRARVQRFVADQLTGPRPSSVECPAGVKARPSTTFDCSVSYFDGSTASVTVHVIDKKGDVTVSRSDIHPSGG